jgi:hypothetical protein
MALEQQKKQQMLAEQKTSKYEKGADKLIKQLAGITGQTLPDYIKSTGTNWNQYVSSERPRLTQSIEAFDPNILGSASAQRASAAYRQMAGEYQTGIRGLTSDISANLRGVAQDAPEQVFSRLASNPAFNLQYDRRAMRLAAKPPTQRSDVESMKDLYTYNV